MKLAERQLTGLFDEICCGNPDALRFVMHWNLFCHGVDDIVDMPEFRESPEQIVSVFAEANVLFTLPFYQANFAKLQTTVMLVANAYADSVAWEKSSELHQQRLSDVLRSYGNEMLIAIALICGGYQHMRRMSPKIRERSWADQHGANGERN